MFTELTQTTNNTIVECACSIQHAPVQVVCAIFLINLSNSRSPNMHMNIINIIYGQVIMYFVQILHAGLGASQVMGSELCIHHNIL